MSQQDLNQIQLVSTIIVAIATVLLTIFTGGYMVLTRRMVEEMRSNRDPKVVVDLEIPDQLARFTVTNSGLSPATDISFIIKEDAIWHGLGNREPGLKSLSPIKNGISYLPPGRTLKYMVGVLDWKNPDYDKHPVKLKLAYSSETNKKFSSEIEIDVSQLSGVLFESFRNPTSEIAEAIKDSVRDRSPNRGISYMFRQPKKQCPMCGESIPAIARKCSHCGEMLRTDDATNPPLKQ